MSMTVGSGMSVNWSVLKSANPNLPERLGQPWTDEEDGKVLELIQQEHSIHEIAAELKSTNGSIIARLNMLSVEMHKKGIVIETIQVLTGLDNESIQKSIRKQNEKDVEKKRKKQEMANVPMADIMEIKLILHEIRDIMRKLADKV